MRSPVSPGSGGLRCRAALAPHDGEIPHHALRALSDRLAQVLLVDQPIVAPGRGGLIPRGLVFRGGDEKPGVAQRLGDQSDQ